jgi:hypothetical protein
MNEELKEESSFKKLESSPDDLPVSDENSDGNPIVQALADHLMSIARHERMVVLSINANSFLG